MPKFRKKPVVIEAVQFTEESAKSNFFIIHDSRPYLIPTMYKLPVYTNGEIKVLRIPTLEGVHAANIGDWIICGVHGEKCPRIELKLCNPKNKKTQQNHLHLSSWQEC